jgi:ubiquinone/menaquinone biosynthesis C-methylase UbiE
MKFRTPCSEVRPSEHYDRVALAYDLERLGCRCGRLLNETELEIVASLIPAGSEVLDVGAGTGRFSHALAAVASMVVGADASRPMLAVADQKRGANAVSRRVALVCCSAAELPFTDCSFDAVVSVKLLSHFDDIEPLIAEMGRVLRWGGRIVLDVPHVLAGAYGHLGLRKDIQSYHDYVHPFQEIAKVLLRQSITITRKVPYSLIPSSFVHVALCPRTSALPTKLLALLTTRNVGLLSMVEGRKQ